MKINFLIKPRALNVHSRLQTSLVQSKCSPKSLCPYTDSPKLRNKGQKVNKARPAVSLRRQSTSAGATRKLTSAPSTLVVVNTGGTSKGSAIEKDPDIARLQVNFALLTDGLVSVTTFVIRITVFTCRASRRPRAGVRQSRARSTACVAQPARCTRGRCERCWI